MHQAGEQSSAKRTKGPTTQPTQPTQRTNATPARSVKNSTEVTTGQRPLPIFILCTPRLHTSAHTGRRLSKDHMQKQKQKQKKK